MPLPIHVALIGATCDAVTVARKHFRLSAPGIGAAYLSALDAKQKPNIVPPSELPESLITLWVCLDRESLAIAQKIHEKDSQDARYGRGFYKEVFPVSCLLIEQNDSISERNQRLATLARNIVDAWYGTS